jgi:hypothetical protein
MPQDQTEPTDQAINDREGSGIDMEFGHDDINMTNIFTVEETSQCLDSESENNDDKKPN